MVTKAKQFVGALILLVITNKMMIYNNLNALNSHLGIFYNLVLNVNYLQ